MSSKKTRTPGAPRNPNQKGGLASWVPWVAAVVVIGAIAVIAVVSAKAKQEDQVKEWDSGAPVTVTGDPIPPIVDPAADAAAGLEVPEITGVSVTDGEELTIGDTGKGKVIAVVAHWCPHCQREVPQIVDYLNANDVPDDVEILGLTTGMDSRAANFPPSAWLEAEKWPIPTVVDNADGEAAAALGVSGYPYFLVVDADNKVVMRTSGSIGMDVFADLITLASGES